MDIALASRLIVGVIFALSSTGKWLNLTWFANAVSKYDFVPGPAARPLALLVTLSETVLAVLLLFGVAQPVTQLAAAFFIGALTLAVTMNLFRGRTDLDCGCSGSPGEKVSWYVIGRNLGLIGLATLSTGMLKPMVMTTDAAPAIFAACISLLIVPTSVRWLQTNQVTGQEARS